MTAHIITPTNKIQKGIPDLNKSLDSPGPFAEINFFQNYFQNYFQNGISSAEIPTWKFYIKLLYESKVDSNISFYMSSRSRGQETDGQGFTSKI